MARRPRRSGKDTISLSAKKFGVALVEQGIITEGQKLQVFEHQYRHGGSLKEAILGLGLATEDDVIGAMYDIDVAAFPIAGYEVPEEALSAVPSEFAHRNKLIPVSKVGDSLTVVMSDPLRRTSTRP